MTHAGDMMGSHESLVQKALALYNAGEFAQALGMFQNLETAFPENPDILVGLGMAMLHVGNVPEAERHLRKAIALNAEHDVACRSLAIILLKKEELSDAETFALRSTEISPQSAPNQLTLGVVKAARGKDDEAVACYDNALSINPLYPEALHNRGAILMQRREYLAAARLFISAVASRPTYMDAYRKLWASLRDAGSSVEAQALLQYIASISPADRDALGKQADCAGGERDEISVSKNHSTVATSDGLVEKINHCMQVSMYADSAEEIVELREVLAARFDELMEEPGCVADPLASLSIAPRFLLSLPLQDRLLRTKLANLLLLKAPSLAHKSPHLATWKDDSPLGDTPSPFSPELLGERTFVERAASMVKRRIRVGICSESFAPSTVGSLFSGLVASLPRDLFELYFYQASADRGDVADSIRDRADAIQVLPNELHGATAQVAQARLDIVLYTNPEAAPLTYFLAFAALAPIQCVLWGNAETTGIPTIHYFVASQALVAGRAQSQFSESLVTLPQLTGCSHPPTIGQTHARDALALSGEKVVFLCPEPLDRIHPDTDYVLQRILQGEQSNVLVLVERDSDDSATHLMNRLRRTMPDCIDRVIVKSVSCEKEFSDLLAASDVVLESLHSTYPLPICRALSCGKPVVTLPEKSLRSRIAYGYYKQIEYTETVARSVEHYVQIALMLGRDSGWRDRVAAVILGSQERALNAVADSATELARFFIAAIHKRHSAVFPRGDV